MRLANIMLILEKLLPKALAESWDNVGLLLGNEQQDVQRLLLCIDLTPAVLKEALAKQCQGIIAYHPPLFHATKKLQWDHVLTQACWHRLFVYSPHTILDVVSFGTNEVLAKALNLQDMRPLRTQRGLCKQQPLAADHALLVVYAPLAGLGKLSQALFDAGAGRIGHYQRCSFHGFGFGCFQGDASTQPLLGYQKSLEQVAEVRLEMRVPLQQRQAVLRALKSHHPYEEPVFEWLSSIHPQWLEQSPEAFDKPIGQGRIGFYRQPLSFQTFLRQLKTSLGLDHLQYTMPNDLHETSLALLSVAVAAGAGKSLLQEAAAQRANIFVTGELSHHDSLEAMALGMPVVLTGHSNSERLALASLQEILQPELPAVALYLSKEDKDPLKFA